MSPVSSQQGSEGHLLEIRDGGIHLDGVQLVDAVPDGLDLTGLALTLDYSGPITPVVEVDGQAYVLENGRLVRFEESMRAGERVYVVGEAQEVPMDVSAMDDERIALVSQEAYRRELAERDRALYGRMQEEHALETRVDALAAQFRRMPPGADKTRLRAELRSRLGELFVIKQANRREEVDRAQAELDGLRQQLDARDAQQEAIIERRLRRLCGEE
ncbi:MAG TPA: hypothetical protein VF594_07300 [Rubricoccaceae bacterium]|jgi:hypothetical protein